MKAKESNKCVNCAGKEKLVFFYKDFNYYKCRKCELVSTLPYPSKKQILSHYKLGFKSGNYKFLREFSSQYGTVYKQLADILEESLVGKSFKSKKILDVGCFTGEFLEELKKRGADIYGLELQSEAVKIANKKLHGRVKKADLNSYKIEGSKFDAVSLLGILEHVKDPPLLIKQCYSILKKDGTLIIQTPDSSSSLAKTLGKYWPPYSPVEHIHLFGHKSIKIALSKSGFGEIRFRNHWKKLPIGYVYNMFNVFGPEYQRLLRPIAKNLRKSRIILPFYIGEMIVVAKKK